MNDIIFFEKAKCILNDECNLDSGYTNEIQQQETQTEITETGFHAFDIDSVFGN